LLGLLQQRWQRAGIREPLDQLAGLVDKGPGASKVTSSLAHGRQQ
jgi:hypothetical protein